MDISQLFDTQLGTLLVVFGVIVTIAVLIIATRVFFPDGSGELKEKLRKQSEVMMSEADKMLRDEYYPQAVIQAHKALEKVMRGILNDTSISSFDAIQKLKSRSKLSAINVDRAHNLRKLRNKAAHGEIKLREKDTRLLLSDARQVISQLVN